MFRELFCYGYKHHSQYLVLNSSILRAITIMPEEKYAGWKNQALGLKI